MDCPNCGLFNSETAKRCDCGYDLSAPEEHRRAARKSQADRRARRALGGAGLVAGGIFAVWRGFERGWGGTGGMVIIAAGVALLGTALRAGPQRSEDYVGEREPRQ